MRLVGSFFLVASLTAGCAVSAGNAPDELELRDDDAARLETPSPANRGSASAATWRGAQERGAFRGLNGAGQDECFECPPRPPPQPWKPPTEPIPGPTPPQGGEGASGGGGVPSSSGHP